MSLARYQEAIDAGLDKRTAGYVGACGDIIAACESARATKTRFLESRGLTWDSARALDVPAREALQEAYTAWLAKQESIL